MGVSDNLFEGLPPPSAERHGSQPQQQEEEEEEEEEAQQFHPKTASSGNPPQSSTLPASPPPVLKSALKRPKPLQPNPDDDDNDATAPAPGKKLRFKTTTDASEKQVTEAMRKIASHIKNPSKFSKASKLAIQLIQAGSVKPETKDHFFSILEAAMSSSTSCTEPSVRADYHALFSAAKDASQFLNKKQNNQLTAWTINAVVANDLSTDDSFQFSKTAGQIKEAISNLPVATEDDDIEEAAALKDETETTDEDKQTKQDVAAEENNKQQSDPFGLDALIPNSGKKGEKTKGKEAATKIKEEDDTKRFLKSQREALIICLEIAARRYKTPWCQTVIDILVKHAHDNVARFTSRQRDAIEKLWASIREQHTRRKNGKSVTGKLDVNAFEWLQQKYANEKISIRHAVGGSGDRRAQQWLG